MQARVLRGGPHRFGVRHAHFNHTSALCAAVCED